ncbi:MAG: radical SAM protein [Gemmatimonadota bacterium]
MSDLLATAAKTAANLAWNAFQAVNTRIPDSPSIQPEWAPGPLPKSYERTKPPLGWPRETDSLCPDCVIEVRDAIIAGDRDLAEFTEKKTGEIRAQIVEEDGKIKIRKRCERHGEYEDTLSIDPKLSELLERRFFGRDYRTSNDDHVHRHGSSTIRYGRGAVLTLDLTNRCNMMCNPCFMDANQVGYVHELTLDEIKEILEDSISFKPRRQMSVQYSGGEPTMSPHFLEACRYAKEIGYYNVQAATNGLRFALEPEFAYQAKEAGLDMAYLQFDGVTNEANRHRHISNLFDAKWLAIERMHNAGIDITPVTTVINTINDQQVGPILDFVIQNSDKMGAVSFQPVSFTGRDEHISNEDRRRQRYTISHLAHEFSRYFDGRIDPYRDFYPLGAMGAFTWLADHLRGPQVEFGGLSCSCHPNCGASLILAINNRTKEWAPFTAFFDVEQFVKDINVITDTSRGMTLSKVQAGLALLRNLNQKEMPPGLTTRKFLQLANRKMGGSLDTGDTDTGEWNLMWVGGMWFQDLWTYDFRRTEMCVIPYATQEGEISFCAYNTGAGWRKIVENMHMVAKTRDWFKDKGRHQIYAGDRPMDLRPGSRSLPIVEKRKTPPHPGTVQLESGCGCH